MATVSIILKLRDGFGSGQPMVRPRAGGRPCIALLHEYCQSHLVCLDGHGGRPPSLIAVTFEL